MQIPSTGDAPGRAADHIRGKRHVAPPVETAPAEPGGETAAEPINAKAARRIEHMLSHGPFQRSEGELERRLTFAGVADDAASGVYAAREAFLGTVAELRAQYEADPHPGAHGHFRRDVMRALNDLRASIRDVVRGQESEIAVEADEPAIDPIPEPPPEATLPPETTTPPPEAGIPVEPTQTLIVEVVDDPVVKIDQIVPLPIVDAEAFLLEGILASVESEALLIDEET
jgi:hypothetical protein